MMCLGIPGEVVEVDEHEALVDFGGAQKRVRIDIVGDELSVGEYVLTHAGFAIRKIPEAQVERTAELYESAIGETPAPGGSTPTASDGIPTGSGDR